MNIWLLIPILLIILLLFLIMLISISNLKSKVKFLEEQLCSIVMAQSIKDKDVVKELVYQDLINMITAIISDDQLKPPKERIIK